MCGSHVGNSINLRSFPVCTTSSHLIHDPQHDRVINVPRRVYVMTPGRGLGVAEDGLERDADHAVNVDVVGQGAYIGVESILKAGAAMFGSVVPWHFYSSFFYHQALFQLDFSCSFVYNCVNYFFCAGIAPVDVIEV